MLNTGVEALSETFEAIAGSLILSLQASSSDDSKQMLDVIQAFRQSIQVMQRLDADAVKNKSTALAANEVSEIAEHALILLDEISSSFANKGLQEQMMQLHQLSLPVVGWLKRHTGKLTKLDIVVNAIASYANTIQDLNELEFLCALISDIIEMTDPAIKQDLEASNPMRPWRILNLNWGIVATRTHNVEIMEEVFEQLIKNIPGDVQRFFIEGVQQMDIVDYPQHVRLVMEKYASRVGSNSVLH